MPESYSLKEAVDAVVPTGVPDFMAVYSRTAQTRTHWRTALGLSVAAAAVLAILLIQDPPPPAFDHQVEAFVELVCAD